MNSSVTNSIKVFTIGHSNLELADFLAALLRHNVEVVCDVRSRPSSFRFPQFNREPLQAVLNTARIRYEFLGESLGGRPSGSSFYHANGMVDYEMRRKAADFRAGLENVLSFLGSQNVALMCAEEDPLECHRFLMICPSLLERGVVPAHIRRGGTLESQRDAEDRLLILHNLTAFTSDSLFALEREEALQDALRQQAKEFAFRPSPETIESF